MARDQVKTSRKATSRRSAKATSARKAAPARKPAPARKTVPAAKAAPARKTAPATKAAPARKTASAAKAAPARKTVPAQKTSAPIVRWTTVPVPLPVGVHVPAPQVRMPHVRVTSPRRLAYYGALGAMAVVGAIEWPVAAAIGAGVWLASRARQRPGGSGEARATPAGRTR
jgi:hypothetical protein